MDPLLVNVYDSREEMEDWNSHNLTYCAAKAGIVTIYHITSSIFPTILIKRELLIPGAHLA